MTTAIIGIGNIGGTVARELASGGEPMVLSAVNPDDLAKLAAEIGSRATAAPSNRDAVHRADTIVLALWLGPMKAVIDEVADLLPGKLVIDTSNPISVGADGNISRTLPDGQSAAEVVSGWLPKGTSYAKAFGTLSAPLLGSSAHRTPEPAVLFYTTDDVAAASEVDLHAFGGLNGRAIDKQEADSTRQHLQARSCLRTTSGWPPSPSP